MALAALVPDTSPRSNVMKCIFTACMWGCGCLGARNGGLGPRNVCPVLPANCGLWWAVVGAVGRQGSLLHPLPPLASLCWQTLEDELFEIISLPASGRELHGGVGGEEVRLPILDFFGLQLQASPVPCTLPPLGLAPRALARRETLHVTLLYHSIDGLDALGVVWSPHLT